MRTKIARKKTSIVKRLAMIMMLIVAIQAVLGYAAIVLSGGFKSLRDGAENSFANMTENRRNTLESQMSGKWSDLRESKHKIQDAIDGRLKERGCTAEDLADNKALNNDMIELVSEDVMDMLRFNSTTEAFIMLQGYGAEKQAKDHCGLVIRGPNETSQDSTRGFMLERGPASVSQSLGIAMDSYWSARLSMDKSLGNMECYTVPVEAADKFPDADSNDLGYWSSFFRWSRDDIEVVSYSIPLVQDGKAYGVLGVTISADYLSSMLPFQELDSEKTGSYILAHTTDGIKYEPEISVGMISRELRDENAALTLTQTEGRSNSGLYSVGKDSYANEQPLNLYSSSSPYYKTSWSLVGIIPKEALLGQTNRMQRLLMGSAIAAIVIAFLGAILASYSFTRPILRIVEEMKSKDLNEKLNFRTTNIAEIDILSEEIDALNTNVRQNAFKMSQIVDLIQMPLGVIECRRDSEQVFCTKKVISMLGMQESHYQNRFLDKTYFNECFKRSQLTGLLEENMEFDYHVKNEIPGRWIHFKSLVDSEKVLISLVDVTKDVQERQKIEFERDYDLLTGLLNRRAFEREVKDALKGAKEQEPGISAMIMWDLDNLKHVNDNYGHDYGDQYIQRAAKVFGSLYRIGGIVGRISGDEFLAFVPNCGTKEKLLAGLSEIKEKLNETKVLMPDGDVMGIRASGGIAWYPDDGVSYEGLKRCADFAMYDTKNSYKGTFKEFDRKTYEKDTLLLHGRELLNKLIEYQMVSYAFQPIVDVKTGEIFAYEALMRPLIKELASPSDVMRLAVAQSRLPDIEALTFSQAFKSYADNRKQFGSCRIFVNSIPNQMLTEEVFCKLFTENHIQESQVVVELVEQEQMDDKIIDRKLSSLRSLGVQVAMDDFGAGYNSESTLLYVRPDYIKIDRSLVQNIATDENRQFMAVGTVKYATSRGIKIIAEGVETKADMEEVIRLGADYLQGYYIGRPDLAVQKISAQVKQEIIEAGERKKGG